MNKLQRHNLKLKYAHACNTLPNESASYEDYEVAYLDNLIKGRDSNIDE